MTIPTTEAPVPTGIIAPSLRRRRINRQVNIPRVVSPVLNAAKPKYTGLLRTSGGGAPFDPKTIHSGYLLDCYIRQAVDKYVELLLKEGWTLEGKAEPVEYLYQRFKLMGLMSDPAEPFELVIERIVRDFVKYGNSFITFRRSSFLKNVTDGAIHGLNGKDPIGAYFCLPILQITPESDKDGNIIGWIQKTSNGASKTFKNSDVLHFAYCKEPGEIWGLPFVLPVIEDIKALRQIEESVLKLIYKHLNPLIHQEIPDVTGTGEGRQEDIDDAADAITSMAVDGYIITPPGHKISVIGAESQAIRAEGYIKLFKQRVFSGLGVSALTMGEADGAAIGTADNLTMQMHNKARVFHYILSQYLTAFIINELLLEGGFNPYANPDDVVIWKWNDIETERRIKEQTHWLNAWAMNGISATDLRHKLGFDPESNVNWEDFYAHKVQIPQLLASKLGIDPLLLSPNDYLKPADHAVTTRDRIKKDSIIDKGGDASPPSNQYSPKGGKTKQSLDSDNITLNYIYSSILEIIPSVKSGKAGTTEIKKLLSTLIPEAVVEPLAHALYADMMEYQDEAAYIHVATRLDVERPTILALMEQEGVNGKNTTGD